MKRYKLKLKKGFAPLAIPHSFHCMVSSSFKVFEQKHAESDPELEPTLSYAHIGGFDAVVLLIPAISRAGVLIYGEAVTELWGSYDYSAVDGMHIKIDNRDSHLRGDIFKLDDSETCTYFGANLPEYDQIEVKSCHSFN